MYETGCTPQEDAGTPPPLPMFEADRQNFASVPSVPRGFRFKKFWPWEEGVPSQTPLPPLPFPTPPPPTTTKTRSGPQRVIMSSGERPIGAAKGTQSDTEALCHPPPPPWATLFQCIPLGADGGRCCGDGPVNDPPRVTCALALGP